MSVRTTIDIPEDLYASLRQRATSQRTSIRSLVVTAIQGQYHSKKSPRLTEAPVKGTGKPAPGSPDRENPYDILFA